MTLAHYQTISILATQASTCRSLLQHNPVSQQSYFYFKGVQQLLTACNLIKNIELTFQLILQPVGNNYMQRLQEISRRRNLE